MKLARLFLCLPVCSLVLAQQPPAAPEVTTTTKANTAELETKDAPVKFSSGVNLVPVTVVVRDSKGQVIKNLTKEDFKLTDNGKPQVISRFSIEKPGAPAVLEKEDSPIEEPKPATPGAPPPVIADHYVAYLFDDLHLAFGDLVRARDAAGKLMAATLQPGDRVAIYTTSGQTVQEFTGNLAKLQDALLRIRPVSLTIGNSPGFNCADVTYYMADLIVNKNDQQATQVALSNYKACGNATATTNEILALAQRSLSTGEQGTRLAATTLNTVVRRISAMPGQRSVVVASPGFLVPFYNQQEITEVINRAIRSKVVISSIDARGLWTDPGLDASMPSAPAGGVMTALTSTYLISEGLAQDEVLEEMAEGTGGEFFHNNNDINEGFRRLAAVPEVIYVLAFTPGTLKFDGKFHTLKVTLQNPKGLTLQARKGYYAPRREEKAADQAKQEIEDAVFSREVIRDIPVALHTQFFKTGDFDAKLSVLARVDIRTLHYRKEQGRNCNDLTLVAALFDQNGNYIAGNQQNINLKLKDETLERKLGSGITVKANFDVKVGSYVLRVVARDSEGQMMAAENGVVEIP